VKPRVIIADDHVLVVDGLRSVLEPYVELIGVAHDGRTFVSQVIAEQPDIGLLDISLPLLNGIEAARQIQEARCGTRIIFVTQWTEREYVRSAFQAGAYGYVLKSSASAELVEAITAVQEGRYYLSQAIARHVGTESPVQSTSPAGILGGELTPRQREVLQLVAEGKTAKEIAFLLKISIKTVEFHKASIMGLLGLRTTAELTRYAVQHHIVSD
jgi:DNA-binding NarL/FixJ family response regulator